MQKYSTYVAFLGLFIYYGMTIDLTNSNEKAAKAYCSSCHLFPEPSLLDKSTWAKTVLPNMGSRLGIVTVEYDPYEQMDSIETLEVQRMNIYPKEPLISERKWKRILKYYEEEAPEKLTLIVKEPIDSTSISPFEAKFLNIGDKEIPQVTLLEYNDESQNLFVGDQNTFFHLDEKLNVVGSWNLQSPASDVTTWNGIEYLLSIGSFEPSDKKEGVLFPLQSHNGDLPIDKVVDSLARPVDFKIGDLNNDGQDDVVICSFGNNTGHLAWYNNFNQEHILSYLPGARMTELIDIDSDGDLDIVAMMSQAWESIDLYINDGKGKFNQKKLLSFSPIHGLSHFEMVDFNEDGHLDLLVSNGDNWDYSQILKPYHGVSLYMNNGSNQFTIKYSYQMPGCSKALARDFDGDGDLDIAAIAFFSGDENSRRFTYLENKGELEFSEKGILEENMGRWMTMDVADINDDDKLDILLGSYFHNFAEFQKSLYQGVETFPQVMVLLNKN